jgi:hypothetical protein
VVSREPVITAQPNSLVCFPILLGQSACAVRPHPSPAPVLRLARCLQPGVEVAHNVWVLERGERAHLAQHAVALAGPQRDALDGVAPSVHAVQRLEDDAEAALAQHGHLQKQRHSPEFKVLQARLQRQSSEL